MPEIRVAVIGGGSWATAIVKMLANNLDSIGWWMRDADQVSHIQKEGINPKYLSSVELDTAKLDLNSDIAEIVEKYQVIILAVPSAFLKAALSDIPKDAFKGKQVFSAIKGIVPENNTIIGEFLHNQYGLEFNDIGVITGPCHAEEVALEKLSYLTVACQDESKAEIVASKLSCDYINVRVSDDIFGTEYAAVLKNIMAVANGICIGLGYGDNFQAVLISNGIKEIKRFVDSVHPISRDIKSSAYLGDLLVTAYSRFSRNRTFGNLIGEGSSVKGAQEKMNMIAEGYYAVKCVSEVNKKHNVDMPITDAVYEILYNNASPEAAMKNLASIMW
ncbi:MAG TPA: NAD(P)H-dependent glycerol-3-phosphate dehydrogenase [Flavobacteriales bacterium]|nr:NAD(P)H-dependent glycerol-3-phosphate dehydrogenase [Flavobacteriales bacterium]